MARSVGANFEDILSFWFAPETRPRWFASNPEFDDRVRGRFTETYDAAKQGKLDAWREHPRSLLALVILFDQFPRNMFRNDARAFATDHLARVLTKEGLAKGFDRDLDGAKLDFFYMPLMHSEAMEDHELLIRLGRGDERYARQHRETIRRFGRYPQRNAALGRQSSPEEVKFLGLE
jgi:uncharacterized protein (DUF924 family)